MSAAARIAGLSPAGFYQHRFYHRDASLAIEQSVMDAITEKAVDASALIRSLSIRAVETVRNVMETAEKDEVRLKAAADLLDRNPETSKTLRVSETSFVVNARDIASLRDAMKEASVLPPLAPGDSIKLPSTTPPQTENAA